MTDLQIKRLMAYHEIALGINNGVAISAGDLRDTMLEFEDPFPRHNAWAGTHTDAKKAGIIRRASGSKKNPIYNVQRDFNFSSLLSAGVAGHMANQMMAVYKFVADNRWCTRADIADAMRSSPAFSEAVSNGRLSSFLSIRLSALTKRSFLRNRRVRHNIYQYASARRLDESHFMQSLPQRFDLTQDDFDMSAAIASMFPAVPRSSDSIGC